MSKFKYQGRTEETVNKRIADRGGDYDQYLKVDPIKVTEGANAFRILPPTWDTKGDWGDNWAIDAWLHWDVGSDNATYLCLNKMKGEACPICEMVEDLDNEELRKKLKAKRSLFAYVIDRKDEKTGPQVWRLGKQLEGNLQFRSKDKKTGAILPIDHPERGYDISFNRIGTDEKTKYTNEDVDRESSFLHEDQKKEEKWLDYITDHPLPEQLNYYSYDHIAAVCKGRKSKRTGDEDPPSRSRRGEPAEEPDRGGRRRNVVEEDEPAPRSRRGGADNDEIEDTRPRRRSEPEAEDPPPRRRAAVEEDEPAPRRRAAVEEDEPAPRRRAAEPEEDPPAGTRVRRDQPDEPAPRSRERLRPAEDEPAPRERAHRARTDEDDEIPSERPRRAAPKADDDGEEEPAPETTTGRAKASLERLKPK